MPNTTRGRAEPFGGARPLSFETSARLRNGLSERRMERPSVSDHAGPAIGKADGHAVEDQDNILSLQRLRLMRLLDEVGGGASSTVSARRSLEKEWRNQCQVHLALVAALQDLGLDGLPSFAETRARCDLVSWLLQDSLGATAATPQLNRAVDLIRGLVEREETPVSGLLARARAEGISDKSLKRRIAACMADLDDLAARKRQSKANQEDDMPSYSAMPDRDERGRFMSDDDRGGRGGRGQSMGSRRSDDDDRRGSRGSRGDDGDRGQGGWFGDREGHAEAARRGWESREDYRGSGRSRSSDDDDRRSSSRSRDDDYRSSSRGRDHENDRGQGGWFGDFEGHSEASRRGWEGREDYRGSRSARRDDDDDRRSSYGRGRDDDDRRSSYARRRDDDDDRRASSRGRRDDDNDRGQGGWFGDSEGHAEAARRGWESRDDGRSSGARGRDDDDRRSSSARRRDDDDDRRFSSRGSRGDGGDHGQGGWFGDSEGHSEASRRGWESRRDDDDDRGRSRGRR